jgi:hypothetical protein
MTNPSNLYAEKVFSEHPISLWSLDETLDYISLVTEEDRDLSQWTAYIGSTKKQSNTYVETITDIVGEPFPNSNTFKITAPTPTGKTGNIKFISNHIVGFNELDEYMKTVSMGAYIYSLADYISSVEIGFEYIDEASGGLVYKYKNFDTPISDRWMFLSETFDIPFHDNIFFRPVINIKYIKSKNSAEVYEFLVNGLSLGQWSEEFNATSLGVNVQSLSEQSDIALSTTSGVYAVPANAYGLDSSKGFYLSKQKTLSAKNAGIPIVYGSSNVTTLLDNGDLPSLVIPGHGFLNESGRYKTYTFEMWLRVNGNTTTSTRIFGPISSRDGLYMDGPFLKFVIGSQEAYHYIGEWFRPILLHIRFSESLATVLVNGEEVFSIKLIDSLTFPSKLNSLGKDQDFLGLYSSSEIYPFDIDCIAIYPYLVQSDVAKRRYVYGQGVEFPENINTAYSGTSVFIDYPFANYANDYSYPKNGKWNQGILENLGIENNTLSTPNYALPNIVFNNRNTSDWSTAIKTLPPESDKYVLMKPNNSWSETDGYILFNNINILKENMSSVYGVFKITERPEELEKQVLMLLYDDVTKNYFSVSVGHSKISYDLYQNNIAQNIYESDLYAMNDQFIAGIDIDRFSNYYGKDVSSFFGNRSSLKLYVGGTKEFSNTFTGKIYSINISTERNLNKISYLFDERGVPVDFENVFDLYSGDVQYDATGQSFYDFGTENDLAFWKYVIDGGDPYSFATTTVLNHTASYTMFVSSNEAGESVLDIAVDSYWEDYLPLSYFAKYVDDGNGNKKYDIDFIQFNIDYPAPSKFTESVQEGSWTYQELKNQFSYPIQRDYSSLDNHLFTGFDTYNDLKNKSTKSYTYDTSNSIVRTFVSFQLLSAGANAPQDYFTVTEPTPKDGIILPGPNWLTTKYEVVDNVIIYPPSGIAFDKLAIVTHIDINVKGITDKNIMIRSLQYASQALSVTNTNIIGTRFGTNLKPYKKVGLYFDYKNKNPFSIYKGSTPYLYLTKNSGIQVRGTYDPEINRGISIPINESKAKDFKVIAMQMALRYDQDFFPYSPTEIFEIQSNNSYIKFYMVATHPSGTRAKIYAVNLNTGTLETNIAFYLNGKIVKDPVITIKEWSMLGISFPIVLDFGLKTGALRITGPLVVNTISHYKSTNLQEVQQTATRPWYKVASADTIDLDWIYWDTSFKWQEVLILSRTSYYGVNPSDIYRAYTGTNKVVVDNSLPVGGEDHLRIKMLSYSLYKDVTWQSNIIKAV